MSKNQAIRLNESQFNNFVKKIVTESVKRVLNEDYQPWSPQRIGIPNDYTIEDVFKKSKDKYYKSFGTYAIGWNRNGYYTVGEIHGYSPQWSSNLDVAERLGIGFSSDYGIATNPKNRTYVIDEKTFTKNGELRIPNIIREIMHKLDSLGYTWEH